MKRRLLALLLVLSMLLPMIPMGTLAEEEEPVFSGISDVTAKMAEKGGVDVTATGYLPATEGSPLYVVAAAFDPSTGRMTDSEYTECTDSDKGQYELRLYKAQEDDSVYVYVLNGDLQPYTTEAVQAQWEYSGQYGEYIDWAFVHGELYIKGGKYDPETKKDMPVGMPAGDYPWSRFASRAEALSVYGISVIGDDAFRNFTKLDTIILDENVTVIGEAAFYGVEEAEVNVSFDWDTVTVAPGNDIIENARPVEDGDIEETPDLEATEPETTEAAEPTEETVPETTEETVAETTEETVPETVEVPAETPEEELTSEEAASEGYYVAPEGAQLQEDAALEELAAFTGTDKTAKGRHTASFTGLAPYELYTFLVSPTPGSLDGLKYIDLVWSDGDGNATVTYIPKDESKAIVQLYGPENLTLAAEQEYITLKPKQEAKLRLTSNKTLDWIYSDYDTGALNVESEDNTLFTVNITDDFLKDLRQVETRYITFHAYANGQEATVMVRVDLIPAESQIKDATLGETAVTHNYYSTEATPIPVFLGIDVPEQEPVEETADALAAFDEGEEEETCLIRGVDFSENTPADVREAFEITVQDDHTLLLSTRTTKETAEYAADGGEIDIGATAKKLKSSYNVGFVLTVDDNGDTKTLDVTGSLKLNVQKKLPTLKAETVNLNTYAQPTGVVTVTGGEVERIESVADSKYAYLTYIEENNTVVAWLNDQYYKSGTVSLTAQVWVKGYNQPVALKVPVKIDTKAPALKLSKTTVNTVSVLDLDEEIPVLCTTKGVDTEKMDIWFYEIKDSRGKDLSEVYEARVSDGKLCLTSSAETRPIGKQSLVLNGYISVRYRVGNYGLREFMTPVSFKLTVNNVETGVKMNKSSLILNAGVLAGVPIQATVTGIPEDGKYAFYYYIRGDSYLTDEVKAGEYFNLEPVGADKLILTPNYYKIYDDPDYDFEAFLSDTYTLYVGVQSAKGADKEWELDQDKWAKVRFTLTQDEPVITRLKASGTIDLNNDDSRITLTPTYGGKQSVASVDVTVTDGQGNYYSFDRYMDGENILIGRSAYEENLKPGTYTATVNVWWGGGIPSTDPVTTTFKVTAKKPTLKVTGKLDSGKENSALYVTSSYKHYVEGIFWGETELQLPEVTLTPAGKNAEPVDEKLYNVEYEESGRIKITPQMFGGELLKAGKYTLTLTYGEKELVQTASITVSQTAPTLKLSKTSLTLHPDFAVSYDEEYDYYANAVSVSSAYSGIPCGAKYEFYQANGKTRWDDQPYVSVEEFSANGAIVLGATGKVPAKDTTVKIKVTPDSRIPGKFGWITVKILGGKSLTKKLAFTASNALDPSYSNTDITFTAKAPGFDNEIEGEVVLQKYDKAAGWQDVKNDWRDEESGRINKFYNGWAYANNAYISMHDIWDMETAKRVQYLDPNGKYRMVVKYIKGYDSDTGKEVYSDNVTATVDLKVAYGKNKFTVAQPIVMYKQDSKAGTRFYIDQQDSNQQIADVVIKNQNTGFTLESNDNTLYARNDWTLYYTGDVKKLKTTTLTLQIYLKGNEYDKSLKTQKPNATVNVKVTVK